MCLMEYCWSNMGFTLRGVRAEYLAMGYCASLRHYFLACYAVLGSRGRGSVFFSLVGAAKTIQPVPVPVS